MFPTELPLPVARSKEASHYASVNTFINDPTGIESTRESI
jgi:hypothetical protein